MHTIEFPHCEWCGADDPYRCPLCGHYACAECTIVIPPYDGMDEPTCEHQKFEPFEGDDWNKSVVKQKG